MLNRKFFIGLVVMMIGLLGLSGVALADDHAAAKININTATVDQLVVLDGIGEAYAQRIVEYRQAHGQFANIEDIRLVKGIGEKTFEKNKDKITVGQPGQ